MARWWPIREVCLFFTHNDEFSKSLEGDLSWDRVRRCRLFSVIQVHNRNCSFKKNSVVVGLFLLFSQTK